MRIDGPLERRTWHSALVRHSRLSLVIALMCAACSPTRGCAESRFELAPESRLPRWFTLPPGQSRSDVTVVMTYYLGLTTGRTATFVLREGSDRKVSEMTGPMQGDTPHILVPPPTSGDWPYPRYEVVVIKGITEVIEHRQKGSLFYITDDAAVKQKLGVADR